MTKEILLSRIHNNRHRLINAYNFHCKETAANCAFELTNNAILKQYIESRDSIPGSTLRNWAKNKNPPLWACRSAASILLNNGVSFREEEDVFLLVYFFLVDNNFNSSSDGKENLPSHINNDFSRSFVDELYSAEIFPLPL